MDNTKKYLEYKLGRELTSDEQYIFKVSYRMGEQKMFDSFMDKEFSKETQPSHVILKGKVKWFNAEKGYGFLETEDGKDVFAHFSQIITNGFKCLNDGDLVTFETGDTIKGCPQAKNIRKLLE